MIKIFVVDPRVTPGYLIDVELKISMSYDHLVRKNVYLRTQAAKARLALRKVCHHYGLNYERLLETFDDPELELIMRELQVEAQVDANEVVGKTG